MEAMAMFWEADNPERAVLAANAVAPLYEDVKPGQPLVTLRQDGQLILGYMVEVEFDD